MKAISVICQQEPGCELPGDGEEGSADRGLGVTVNMSPEHVPHHSQVDSRPVRPHL